MKKFLTRVMAMASLLFAVMLMPSICGQAAESGYKLMHFGLEPPEIITNNYRLRPSAGITEDPHITLIKGKKVIKDNIPNDGGILYGSKDFYYVKRNTIFNMNMSGKNKKIASIKVSSDYLYVGLAGIYKNWLYCYSGGTIYKVNINSGKAAKIYSSKETFYGYPGGIVTSGKDIFFKCRDSKRIIRVDMAIGKAATAVKKNTDLLWGSSGDVYISTVNNASIDLFDENTRKLNTTIQKYSTKSKKFVKDTTVKQARAMYADDQIIVYKKNGTYYLNLRKIKQTKKIDCDYYVSFDDKFLVKGNYCYYVADKDQTSTIWKVSLKTGKTVKVKTIERLGSFQLFGGRAFYRNNNDKYLYVTLK